MSTSLWRLEQAWASDLEGRQQWQRDNDASLRRQADDLLQAERAGQLEPTRAEARRLHERNQALLTSWSWRLTWPLRALAGWVRR